MFKRQQRIYLKLLTPFALIFIGAFTSACSSLGAAKNTGPQHNSISISGSFGEPDETDNTTRASTSLESSVELIGRSFLVDPVLRPFTTIKALYGYTIKSTAGFLDRAFIENVRFPILERKPIPELSTAAPMDLDIWERELDEITGSELSYGSIKFLIDGDQYFSRLNQAIDESSESINMRTYIFDNDDVALDLADRLRLRSDEVDIKILVDGLGDLFATRLDSKSMSDDVELPSSIGNYLTYQSKVEFRKKSNPWLTGDHVKVTLIDNKLAFIGGMNIGREYRYDWHDLMMEVQGPIIKDLQFEFERSWIGAGVSGDYGLFVHSLKGYEPDLSKNGIPIRIITTTIHDSKLYRAQLEAIRRSRSYIYIENAYFSDDKILFELARARRRGVDVRVIVAASSDSGILNLSGHKTINTMLRNGIRVYAYPGMTHVKAAVYDGWACLGSANFDKLSLQINQELNLGTSDTATVNELLRRVFIPDFEISTELRDFRPLETRHHLAEFIADEFL